MSPIIVALGLLAGLLQVHVPPTSAGPGEYRIGPGDLLKVTVYGNDDLSQTVAVQSDGTFQFPLIGTVRAADLTPASLARELAEQLQGRGFVRQPQVNVVVQEYRSQRVFVLGEVSTPGTYALTGPTTVLEVLARAGLPASAVGSEIMIIRPAEPAEGPVMPTEGKPVEVMTFALSDLRAGDLTTNQALRANDTVLVSPGPRIFVSGEVRSPGGFPYARGLTARQAVALAGGLTEDGSWKGIRVVRRVGDGTKEMKLKPEEPVMPGDIIEVRAKLF